MEISRATATVRQAVLAEGPPLRFPHTSAMMTIVRILFALALVLHLSGVPAAAVSPCATGAADHECCIRHRTEAGGPVIGYCGCQMKPESGRRESVVSTPAPPEGAGVITILSELLPDLPALVVAAPRATAAFLPGPGPSPPCLSGAGFRC